MAGRSEVGTLSGLPCSTSTDDRRAPVRAKSARTRPSDGGIRANLTVRMGKPHSRRPGATWRGAGLTVVGEPRADSPTTTERAATAPGDRGGANRGAGSVRLERVVKRFGDVVAVAGVDLHVAAGEFFSMLGPSGSGKTTTL